MVRRLKFLSGLSTLALTGAAALGGCGADNEGERDQASAASAPAHGAHTRAVGEGEQENGEGLATADADDVAYITQLLLVRGHLQAGVALYAVGEPALAAVHMKHPQDELYASLVPAFEARGASGFAVPLDTLAESVAGGESLDRVEADLAATLAGVDASIESAAASPRDVLLAVAQTLRTAGDEFDIGVRKGAIVNEKEYQDAYGFMTTVIDYLGGYDPGPGMLSEAVATAREQAAIALAAAPTVTPPASLSTSDPIYGAAARIEIIARGL